MEGELTSWRLVINASDDNLGFNTVEYLVLLIV